MRTLSASAVSRRSTYEYIARALTVHVVSVKNEWRARLNLCGTDIFPELHSWDLSDGLSGKGIVVVGGLELLAEGQVQLWRVRGIEEIPLALALQSIHTLKRYRVRHNEDGFETRDYSQQVWDPETGKDVSHTGSLGGTSCATAQEFDHIAMPDR